MKVIYVEPGTSVIQAFSNAYFACKKEPITVCANGVRAVFMPDDASDEIEVLEPKQYVDVTVSPAAVCTEKNSCGRYFCNGKDYANCIFYPQTQVKINRRVNNKWNTK
jgi:hypothetical protein